MGRGLAANAAKPGLLVVFVDTSTWIDYFRGKETVETLYLSDLVSEDADICVSGIILTEILQGIPSDKEHKKVSAYLSQLIFLPMSKPSYFQSAAIYREAKTHGHVIRSTTDCLIAACAIEHSVSLLQNDKDYLTIAKFSMLKLIELIDR